MFNLGVSELLIIGAICLGMIVFVVAVVLVIVAVTRKKKSDSGE